MKDTGKFWPSVKESKQTDTRIEARREKQYGLQIIHHLTIGEIPKAEDFEVYHSDISYHENIRKRLDTYLEAFKANASRECSIEIGVRWWNRTENFIVITYTFHYPRPKDIPSVSSIQPDLKRTEEIVNAAMESAWVDFTIEVNGYHLDQNTAHNLNRIFEASRKEAMKRINYNARLAALRSELEAEERKLATSNEWRSMLNEELQAEGVADKVRSKVFTEMEPYFGLHINEEGFSFPGGGDYMRRYKELKKSMTARTEEIDDSEGRRLDAVQESGYCAFVEGKKPEECEDYVEASDADKAVWMEGYKASEEHHTKKEG